MMSQIPKMCMVYGGWYRKIKKTASSCKQYQLFSDYKEIATAVVELCGVGRASPPGGGGGEGGGGTLIFSHIRRLGPFFLVQNSEFQFFGGFQKNEYFLGV